MYLAYCGLCHHVTVTYVSQKNEPRDFVVSPTKKKEKRQIEMRGATSAVVAAFPVLAAVALSVVLVAAAAIATVLLCCRRTGLHSCHHHHCRPCHHHRHDIQSPSPRCPCLVAHPLLLSLQLSLPCHPCSHRCCCRLVNPALALTAIPAAAVAAAQPPSLPLSLP